MNKIINCDKCGNTGYVDCEHCYGGQVNFDYDEPEECSDCDGDGCEPCDKCKVVNDDV